MQNEMSAYLTVNIVRSTNSKCCNPVGKFEQKLAYTIFISPIYASTAAVSCAMILSDHVISILINAKWNVSLLDGKYSQVN